MLSPQRYQDAKREEGFTLIELLVVVIIIGILAAIAIPVFLRQRENAWRGAAETDARNAALMVEGYYTAEREYPATFPVSVQGIAGPLVEELANDDGVARGDITVSNGVILFYELDASEDSFVIYAQHEQITNADDSLQLVAVYDSAAGGLQTSFSTTGDNAYSVPTG
jgi:type IV pilus assembly protein PilA